MAHVIVFFVYHYFIHLFMEPVYAKSSFLDDVRKMVEDEYSGKLSLCTQLNVTCHEELGEYGIWLNIGESHLLIDQIKSPMIESFLTDKKQFEDTYATRQVRIKSILIINPDYDELIYDENNLMLYEDDLGEIINDEFDIHGFFEWGREIHPIVIEASVGNPYEKDWEDYHRRGLEYARELRKCLPDEYDLWYHRPFEDKTNTVPDKQLIIE